MSEQPDWLVVGMLGDIDPVSYGGGFVLIDITGTYCPEYLDIEAGEDASPGRWTVRRWTLPQCTLLGGVVSDNRYHPDNAVWFDAELDAMAHCFGRRKEEYVTMLTSSSARERACAWLEVGEYFGKENLDAYPRIFTDEDELQGMLFSLPTYKELKDCSTWRKP